MFKKNGTYVLIFFLLFVWSSLIGYVIYLQGKETENIPQTVTGANYSTSAYSNDELKRLAELKEDIAILESLGQDDFSVGENVIIASKKTTTPISGDDFGNPYQEEVDFYSESNKVTFVYPDVENKEDLVYKNINNKNVLTEKLLSEGIIIAEPEPEPEIIQPTVGLIKYSGEEFLNLYNIFEQNQVNLDFLTKYIYNIPAVDTYIKQKAEDRGYQQRGFARESEIIGFENIKTRPEVKKSYIAMRNELLKKNIRLHFVSGYRSSISQRDIFTRKMNIINPNEIPTGIHDEHLDDILSRSAIPAYSKHHSGYAVDFGCGNDYLVFSFASTPCYDWLSSNNFENARKHGFIPSYPERAKNQGPNPEPWEFVWVGEDTLRE